MNSKTELKNKKAACACLKLNNKLYPVYDGHNTIGRCREAVINISSLAISKQHAVITVFDEKSHYISDFKSSNGTFLNTKKLVPLELNKLDNGASIKFGDVFCTYRKMGAGEVFDDSVETMTCSESVYVANTQEIHSINLPDGINFNEMPTQAFTTKELNINEMPTQVHNFSDFNNESSNDSIDYMTMQKASETQGFYQDTADADNKKLCSKIDNNSDKTSAATSEIIPGRLNSADDADSDIDDLPISQIYPVKTGVKSIIESDSDTEEWIPTAMKSASKYTISDDSETDIEDNESKKIEKSLNDLATEAEDYTDSSKFSFGLAVSEVTDEGSDKGETHIEKTDRNNKKATKSRKSVVQQDHIYCRSDCDDTQSQTQDFEMDKKSQDIKDNINQHSGGDVKEQSTEEVEPIHYETIIGEKNKQSGEKVVQSNEEKQPENELDNLKTPEDRKLEEAADFSDQPTQQFDMNHVSNEENIGKDSEVALKKIQTEIENQNDDRRQNDKTEVEDMVDLPTQDGNEANISVDGKGSETTLKEVHTEIEDQNDDRRQNDKTEVEDVVDLPTQDARYEANISVDGKDSEGTLKKVHTEIEDQNDERRQNDKTEVEDVDCDSKNALTKKTDVEESVCEERVDSDDQDTEELFLQGGKTKEEVKNEERGINQTKDNEKGSEHDDIYMQPTQTLDYFHKESNPTSSKDDDDLFLQPTQALEYLHQDDKPQHSSDSDRAIPSENKNDDDLYFAETQTLETILSSDKDEPEKKSLPVVEEKVQKDEDDELFLPPTQALEYLHREDKVDDSDKKLSPSKDKILELEKSLSSLHDEDDLFIPPTQALERLLSEEKEQPSSKNDNALLPPPIEFKTPSPLRKSARKVYPSKKKIAEEEDDDILPPTQALEALHEDSTHFNQVEDQLYEIFASQPSLLGTQQLVDVLETSSADDVVEDSMYEESRRSSLPRININKPISAETIKEILAEDVEDDEKEAGPSEENADNKRTTRQKQKNVDAKSEGSKPNKKEQIAIDDKSKSDRIESEEKSRRSGRKQKLVVSDDKEEEVKKRGRRKENLIASEGEKSASDSTQLKNKTEKSVDINTRGRRKQSLIVPEDEVIVESDKKQSQDSNNGDDEQGEKSEKLSSDSTQLKRSRRKQNLSISEDEKITTKTNIRGSQGGNTGGGEPNTTKEQKPEKLATVSKQPKSKDEKTEVKKRGRRKQNVPEDEEDDVEGNKKESQGGNSGDSEQPKSKDEKTEIKQRGRRKQNVPEDEEDDVDSNKKKSQGSNSGHSEQNTTKGQQKKLTGDSTSTKRGRRNQNLIISEDKSDKDGEKHTTRGGKPESIESKESENMRPRSKRNEKLISTEDTDSVSRDSDLSQGSSNDEKSKKVMNNTVSTRSGRRLKDASSDELNKIPEVLGNQLQNSNEAENKRTNKRKNDKEVKTDATPSKIKKKGDENKTGTVEKVSKEKIGTPLKRTLDPSSYDSEDDFTDKTPKIEFFNNSPKRVRKSARKLKEKENDEDDTISASSSSTTDEPLTKTRRLSANSRRLKKQEQEELAEQNKTVTRKSTSLERTPEGNKLKPKVIFTMMENPELETLIRQLGGSVVDSVDACTVLVTESVKRSQKLLCAVALSKPICGPEWLQACRAARSFVDPWDHILQDKEAEKKWKFSLKESLRRSSKGKPLVNYTFQLMVNNAADVLKVAIESCGGKCVTRSLGKSDTEHKIIVSSENNKSKYSKMVKQNPEIKVVEAEAIFDGTLRQEFRMNDFLLQ